MRELTENEVEYVAQHISASISNQRLAMELIDHCCTRMEELISQDVSFDDSLNRALSELSPHGLHIIQKEWNYQHNLKQSPMKITLYLSGFFAAFFILLGMLFKLLHWPGATAILTLGDAMLIIAMFGVLSSAIRHRRSYALLAKARIYGGAIGGLLVGTGSLFKLMWWPGANIMILFGVLTLLMVFLPLFFHELYKREMRVEVKQ
jgi:hypothetical protein